MEDLFIVTSVVASVELLRRIKVQDWFGAATIVVSAAIGLLAGVYSLGGVETVEAGLIAGLGASGLVTVANRVGGGTTARAYESAMYNTNKAKRSK